MSDHLSVWDPEDEPLLVSVSAGDDHAGIPEEAVRWEAAPGLPLHPLPVHLCDTNKISTISERNHQYWHDLFCSSFHFKF